jgi:hypothetical protein
LWSALGEELGECGGGASWCGEVTAEEEFPEAQDSASAELKAEFGGGRGAVGEAERGDGATLELTAPMSAQGDFGGAFGVIGEVKRGDEASGARAGCADGAQGEGE